jgi:cobalt-precorrin-5B (C1)-methyltransferase
MLLSGRPVEAVDLTTPDGTTWRLAVLDPSISATEATCAIRKDSGDDPDATDGALIYAAVARAEAGIEIEGGGGIGRITRPGLDQPVGAPAINSAPRRMIAQAVREALAQAGPGAERPAGFRVVISCPQGERIAAKTFNPRLGVVGGISILGTTGIVEPMSAAALSETLAREIAVLAAEGGRELLVLIGNYGQAFASQSLGLPAGSGPAAVKASNLIGEAIDQAGARGFRRLLLVGHVGKLAKVGIGILNTHSSLGDGRMEALAACAIAAGAGLSTVRKVLACASTDEAAAVLAADGRLEATASALGSRIQATLDHRAVAGLDVEWVCFMRQDGGFVELVRSPGAGGLIERWTSR